LEGHFDFPVFWHKESSKEDFPADCPQSGVLILGRDFIHLYSLCHE